ncbi:hypothetical protein AA103196_0038 [Ameyamaea chiangmaiensis NBRC 103196]|nr:hypothetical protein AA103196_0038 [Ameyamaea chiangmaiensis NBRC 103196]
MLEGGGGLGKRHRDFRTKQRRRRGAVAGYITGKGIEWRSIEKSGGESQSYAWHEARAGRVVSVAMAGAVRPETAGGQIAEWENTSINLNIRSL